MADIGWVSDDNPVLQQIDAAATRYGVDRNLAHVVAQMESAYNPNAISGAGAQGVMQLMPATASTLGVRHPFDSSENIDAGVRLLGSLLRKYGGDTRLVLAAYNAGEPAVDRAGRDVPNFPETQNYVQKGLSVLYPRQSAATAPAADIGWVPDTAPQPPATAQTRSGFSPETERLAKIAAQSSGLGLVSDISGGFRSLLDRLVGNTPVTASPTPQEKTALGAAADFAKGIAAEPGRVWDELSRSGQAMVNGDPVAAAKHIAFAIPFAGAAGVGMQQYLDRGDIKGAIAHGVGAIAPFAAGPIAESGAPIVGNALEATGTAVKGGVKGAAGAATETVPLKRLGVEIQIPKPLATGAATSAGLGLAGVPHPVGFTIGAAAPIVKGAITGAREALAARAAAAFQDLPLPPEVPLTPEVLPNVRGLPGPAMAMPAPPDASYVRTVPAQYATPEPLPLERGLPAPTIQMPPVADTSGVTAVPAQYPPVEPGFVPPAATPGTTTTPWTQTAPETVPQTAAPPGPQQLTFNDLGKAITDGKSPSKWTDAERATIQAVYDRTTKGPTPEQMVPPVRGPVSWATEPPPAPPGAPVAPEAPAPTLEPAATPIAPEPTVPREAPAAAVQKLTDYVISKRIAPHMVVKLPQEYWQMIADDAGTPVPTADQTAQIQRNVAAKAVETPAQGEQIFQEQKGRIEEGMTPATEPTPGVRLEPLPEEVPPHYQAIQQLEGTSAATRAFLKDKRIAEYLLAKGITPEQFESMPLSDQNALIDKAPAASAKGKNRPFLPKPEGASPRSIGRYADEGIRDIVNTMRWRQAHARK